ncbi:hypothetical protein AMS68_000744 [Peltaster fructicola]|uniref:Metallo-beta-lactamase domain-containing protein n=1 Tax=Peltaster fructicola TaxID=286661 RepID=A0A6H0XKF8_9PEZI|nr:hypothetical protein AMS68_000744 [Peltaster fructicola]
MAQDTLAAGKAPPNLNIPQSDTSVKVSVIDSTTRLKLPMTTFLQPDYVGHEYLLGPAFSFLIEHPSRKPIVFDLGVRYDWQKLPMFPKWRKAGWGILVERDVANILKDNGVDVDGGAIDAIIWSHHHWDHTGDPSLFPGSTELVVGPGFKAAHLPAYPKNPDSTLLETDFEGRNVREVNIEKEGHGLKIGRFHAYDYFGDGSFYLLDTPGHSIGHMCGLARTTADSFVFMGGDASHHGGEFRPTEHMPLPKHISPSPLKKYTSVCPGHLFEEINPDQSATKPFYHVTKSFAHDKPVADWTIAGLGEFDCQDNVLLIVAHDDSLVDPPQLEFYPKSINDWHSKGVARRVKWLFLSDFEGAVKEKDNGGKPFTWGQYP